MQLSVIFEDEYLLVIDKPPGLVVTRSETQTERTLEDILRKDYKLDLKRAGIVHRLDKNTSGLMVVGKTEEVVRNLQFQFKTRTVKKEYLALVHGLVEKMGRVEELIGRNPWDREKFTVLKDGREAVTEYTPLKNFQFTRFAAPGVDVGARRVIFNFQKVFADLNKIQIRKLGKMNYNQFTLLLCYPLTGRTHQIRVHLKYIGHPIVGDDKYAGRKMLRLDHRWCQRQFLHAAKLEFTHPVSEKSMSFESHLPEDLDQVMSELSDYGTFS